MAGDCWYYGLLVLSAVNCGLVFAPDASSVASGRSSIDDTAHIDALRGRLCILIKLYSPASGRRMKHVINRTSPAQSNFGKDAS